MYDSYGSIEDDRDRRFFDSDEFARHALLRLNTDTLLVDRSLENDDTWTAQISATDREQGMLIERHAKTGVAVKYVNPDGYSQDALRFEEKTEGCFVCKKSRAQVFLQVKEVAAITAG